MATILVPRSFPFVNIRPFGTRTFSNMSSRVRTARPQWLETIVEDSAPAPKLYRWTLPNLSRVDEECSQPRDPAKEKRRIHILGMGNLGRLYATYLAALPQRPPITLVVHRKALLEHWKADPGIQITRKGVTERVDDFDIEWWTEQKPDAGPVVEVCDGQTVSNLIVATKAPHALPQVDRLRRYIGETSTVAFVQNGMNKLWPPYGAGYNSMRFPAGNQPNWIVCVTTHGVTSAGTFKSIHASPADVAMGPVSLNSLKASEAEYLMDQILSAPHLDARRVSRADLWVLQLEKLVVNSIINPLTAVLRCKNGVLFSKPDGPVMRVMDLLLVEASDVLQALVRDDSSRDVFFAGGGKPCPNTAQALKAKQDELIDRFSPERLRAMLHAVGEKVKDNTSSMLQDVTAGKRTEIREFNGWLVDTAGYLGGGLHVAYHKKLMALVEEGVILEEIELGQYFPLF